MAPQSAQSGQAKGVTMARSVQSIHAVTAATLALGLVFGVGLSPAAAQGQLSQRQIMQMLGPMMQDEDFNDELNDFAEEHNLDPDMLRAMVAKQMAGKRRGGMSQRQIMQMLGPMMQDEDFDDKLNDFAEEHNLDPDMLRAMVAKQKARMRR